MENSKVILSSKKIQARVASLGKEIAHDYKGKDFVLVCVLNGAYMFASDLSKAIWKSGHTNFEIEFVRISSYGKGRKSNKKPVMTKDVETELMGKDVVIVEDIIETGHTLNFLVDHLKKKKAKSIKICSLLSKPLREVPIEPDYLGFTVRPKDWVEGYGLDTASHGRGRDNIIVRL